MFGHVMRKEEDHVGKRVMMALEVQGTRKRGRPEGRWTDKMKDAKVGTRREQTQDRAVRRRLVQYIDPTHEAVYDSEDVAVSSTVAHLGAPLFDGDAGRTEDETSLLDGARRRHTDQRLSSSYEYDVAN